MFDWNSLAPGRLIKDGLHALGDQVRYDLEKDQSPLQRFVLERIPGVSGFLAKGHRPAAGPATGYGDPGDPDTYPINDWMMWRNGGAASPSSPRQIRT